MINGPTSIIRITTVITLTLAILVALLLPVGYFALSYQNLTGKLEAEAEINAAMVARLIVANPELWRYETYRLDELLARRPLAGRKELRRLLDMRGEEIAVSREELRQPLVRRAQTISAAGEPVARMEIVTSYNDLMLKTVLVAMFGIFLGATLFITLRILPLSAVEQAENALRESNEFLAKIMASSTNAIFVINPEQSIVMANRQAGIFCGIAADELSGRQLPELFVEQQVPFIEEQLRMLWERLVPMSYFEAEIRSRDASSFTVVCGAAPIFSGRSIKNLVVSAEDITARKRAEEEVLRLNLELEQRIDERTRELEAANNELRNKNRELESFSYSISHDLRAPLRHLNGFSRILKEEYVALLDTQGQDYLDRISAASNHMGKLIDDLLDLSRISRSALKRQHVDLAEMARHVAVMLQESEPERRATFTIADGITVFADRTLAYMIVQNLLSNSWKFTAGRDPAMIEFARCMIAGEEVIYVRDNGVGFDMKYAEKLFGAFQRLHGNEFDGTGIGLATVQRIVQMHGGRVWGEGEVGKGATIYFTLP